VEEQAESSERRAASSFRKHPPGAGAMERPRPLPPGYFGSKCAEAIENKGVDEKAETKCAQAYGKKEVK